MSLCLQFGSKKENREVGLIDVRRKEGQRDPHQYLQAAIKRDGNSKGWSCKLLQKNLPPPSNSRSDLPAQLLVNEIKKCPSTCFIRCSRLEEASQLVLDLLWNLTLGYFLFFSDPKKS